MSVGEKLKRLRLNLKKTLKELSAEFDVSVNSIYRWEHDLASPRKPMLQKIAEYYDVPLMWLLHESQEARDSGTDVADTIECGTEQQLLRVYRKLSANSKYKILGYLERIYIETMDMDEQCT